jgi:vitamin B12 transporter
MITALWLTALQISPEVRPSTESSDDEILITASLEPTRASETAASVTLFEEDRIRAFGFGLASDLIRLSPGVSVATSGGQGTETVVRIRGAESNHTLLFIDGIAFNDVAAANAARFDSLAAGELTRIELIRGPQSALWGSEALGGVVSINSPEPLGDFRARAEVELGSRDGRRAQAGVASGGDKVGISATASWLRSDGIDILGGGTGDRDGFENMTLGAKARVIFGDLEAGAVGRYVHHDVAFDGTDPLTFRRADTSDISVVRTWAFRGWLGMARQGSPWTGRIELQHLTSENRNRTAAIRTADSEGRRTRFGGRVGRRFGLGSTRHQLIGALEREEERFSTRDLVGSAGSRSLERSRTALVTEWRADWAERLSTDVALRHDDFSHFADSSTLRAQALLGVGGGLQLLAGYGEGIAQPSFTDLFGFPGFPFVGNPDLRPERSQGLEAGLRWKNSQLSLEMVLFSNDLDDEIVEDFTTFPSSVINNPQPSRRRGLELSAEWQPSDSLSLGANYTYLDTREGAAGLREIRRPAHSANAFLQWRSGPLSAGASLAYVGRRTDRDFDLFPAPIVSLDDYVLASAQLAYRLHPRLEAFGRVENGFDADYQDLVGYNNPGRSVHAGLRFTLGR